MYTRAACILVGGVWIGLAAPSFVRADGVYFVKEGDTLTKISKVFHVEVDTLRTCNSLDGAEIKVGDRLRIPEREIVATFRPAAEILAQETRPPLTRKVVCREETVVHTIDQGDTLSSIARRYRTSVDALLKLNRLKKTTRLAIGRRIVVKNTSAKTYVVRRGDTLQRIASRNGITVDHLKRLNQLDSDLLAPGRKLLLESCDQFALAGDQAPDAAAGAPESGELLTAIAEAAAEATLEARELQESHPQAQEPIAAGVSVEEPGITQRLIGLAKTMLNIPYRFGGTTMRGIDCSAFVQRVFGLLDISLPRTAREQYSLGELIRRDDLTVGDLVFFRTYAKFPSHVGIYLGDDLFIHASSVGKRVTIDSLTQPYYTKRFLGGRRLLEDRTTVQKMAAGVP